MSQSSHEKRKELLGEHPATASGKLLRSLLFNFIKDAGIVCFRCGKEMSREDFSIEHKKSWMQADNPVEAFFDLENVTYSHKKCNYGAGSRKRALCGTASSYKRGCRCDPCRLAQNTQRMKYYTPERRRLQYLKTGN